jgi:GNAT superfamily N-acetyltransferase
VIRRRTLPYVRLVQAFVHGLSPRSRRERYFSAISELPPQERERTTRRPDPRDASLAAFTGGALVALAECAGGEIALVVADPLQGFGVGRELMQRLLDHARGASLPVLHGLVRDGNRAMLRLAASFGFRARPSGDPDLVAWSSRSRMLSSTPRRFRRG